MGEKKRMLLLNDFGKCRNETNYQFSSLIEQLGKYIDILELWVRSQFMRPSINSAIAFSFFLVLIISWPVWGATYYIKTGGNDSLNGLSDLTAWGTIAKVNATVKSGDTIYFRSQDTWTASTGEYVLNAIAGVTYDGSTYGSGTRATLKPKAKLGVVHPAVVKINASNATVRGFNVDGNHQDNGGIYIGMKATSNISNIIVDDCKIHDIGGTDTYVYGVHVGGNIDPPITVSNVTITNTELYNTVHEGFAIYPGWMAQGTNIVDTVLVRNCSAHEIGTASPGYGTDQNLCQYSDGFSIANDSRNVTIEYSNSYKNCAGVSISSSNLNRGYPTDFQIRYNTFHDNKIYGFGTVWGMAGVNSTGSIYGNLFYNNGDTWKYNYSGDIIIQSMAGGTGIDYKNTVLNFYNNTIYSNPVSGGQRYGVSIGPFSPAAASNPTLNFKNNIVYTTNRTGIFDQYQMLTNHSNNVIYRSSGAADEHVNNGTSYNRSGVKAWEASAHNTNPVFTGGTFPTGFTGTYGTNMVPNTMYFAITSGDAIDSGATLGSPYNGCINGAGLAKAITRPQGAAYDIGAYEYKPLLGSPTGVKAK